MNLNILRPIKLFSLTSALLTIYSCQKKTFVCQCEGGLSGQGTQLEVKAINVDKAKIICTNRSQKDLVDGFNSCKIKQ